MVNHPRQNEFRVSQEHRCGSARSDPAHGAGRYGGAPTLGTSPSVTGWPCESGHVANLPRFARARSPARHEPSTGTLRLLDKEIGYVRADQTLVHAARWWEEPSSKEHGECAPDKAGRWTANQHPGTSHLSHGRRRKRADGLHGCRSQNGGHPHREHGTQSRRASYRQGKTT